MIISQNMNTDFVFCYHVFFLFLFHTNTLFIGPNKRISTFECKSARRNVLKIESYVQMENVTLLHVIWNNFFFLINCFHFKFKKNIVFSHTHMFYSRNSSLTDRFCWFVFDWKWKENRNCECTPQKLLLLR